MAIKLGFCRVHQGDPLGGVIKEFTDTDYTHAMIITDDTRNEISEAYFPHVRRRLLNDSELAGIDVYEFVTPLTREQELGILRYCGEAETDQALYSIENLLRYGGVFRKFLGETPDNTELPELIAAHQPVICSQYQMDGVFFGAGVRLLNAPDGKAAPGYIPWSPLIRKTAPLKTVEKN